MMNPTALNAPGSPGEPAAAKVAPIKTAYPGFHPATDAPELATADYLNVDYFSATYLASWIVIAIILMLASLGMGMVLGYFFAYFKG